MPFDSMVVYTAYQSIEKKIHYFQNSKRFNLKNNEVMEITYPRSFPISC